MWATFWELPSFTRYRSQYLDDDGYLELQNQLMRHPTAGAVIPGTGGLRKLRFLDQRRHKGKRGGLRVIYFWRNSAAQVWLFSIFDKDEASDLSPAQRRILHDRLKHELRARGENV